MRWRGQRESSNVDDRRASGGGPGGLSGNTGRRGVSRGRRGGIGIGTIAIALIAAWLFGINPLTVLNMLSGGGMPVSSSISPASTTSTSGTGQPTDDLGRFVSVVLASTEEVWAQKFRASGAQYPVPKLVLFRGKTSTACGLGQSAAGPFYCPADRKVYIDLSFYQLMRDRLGAPGDFAQAYVIAHEIGHHIQNVTGQMKKMDAARKQLSKIDYNKLSVRLELQADCYAGIWARQSQQARGWLEQGDLQEAMNAAAAVGDDNMMKQSSGVVVPESFTHGSAEQRTRWFNRGQQSGKVADCDSFSVKRL